jgi:hypothetical protein
MAIMMHEPDLIHKKLLPTPEKEKQDLVLWEFPARISQGIRNRS